MLLLLLVMIPLGNVPLVDRSPGERTVSTEIGVRSNFEESSLAIAS